MLTPAQPCSGFERDVRERILACEVKVMTTHVEDASQGSGASHTTAPSSQWGIHGRNINGLELGQNLSIQSRKDTNDERDR